VAALCREGWLLFLGLGFLARGAGAPRSSLIPLAPLFWRTSPPPPPTRVSPAPPAGGAPRPPRRLPARAPVSPSPEQHYTPARRSRRSARRRCDLPRSRASRPPA